MENKKKKKRQAKPHEKARYKKISLMKLIN